MALKPLRHEFKTDISFYQTSGTLERGLILVHDLSGSGQAMDQALALVKKPEEGLSGSAPAGLLLNDVVDIDLTRQHINFHKDEVQKGGKVTLLRIGTVVTDAVSGTPTAGNPAYFNQAGQLTPTQLSWGSVTVPAVGRFLSKKDQDGYAKVEINIV